MSIGTGLFKDWLKKVLPRHVAYIGAILFLLGAIVTGINNYNKQYSKDPANTVTKDSAGRNEHDTPAVFVDSSKIVDSIKIPDSSNLPQADTLQKKAVQNIPGWKLVTEKQVQISEGKAYLLDNDVRMSARFYSSYCLINLFFPEPNAKKYESQNLVLGEEKTFTSNDNTFKLSFLYLSGSYSGGEFRIRSWKLQ